MEAGLLDLLQMAVFILGTALHFYLASLLWRRRGKIGSERVFLLVILAALIWNLGRLLAVLLRFVNPGKLAVLVYPCDATAMVGLACIPPLLLHMLLLYMREREIGLWRGAHWGLLAWGYLPLAVSLLPLLRVLWRGGGSPSAPIPDDFTPAMAAWFVSVLAVGAWLTHRLSRKLEEIQERAFHQSLTWGFLAITALVVVTWLVRDHTTSYPRLTAGLVLVTNLATLLPCLVSAYYIYKLNYMELVVVNTLLWTILGVAVVALYIFAIGPLTRGLEEQFSALKLNFRILEALLVVVLIALTLMMRNPLQELLSGLVFQEKGYYRDLFRKLSRQVVTESFVDPSSLLGYVARTVSRELHVAEVVILFFTQHQDRVEVTYSSTPQEIDATRLVQAVWMQGGALTIHDVPDREFVRQMKAQRFETLIPIYEDYSLTGLFALGKRGLRRGLFREEERMLTLLGNQVAVAISNTTVVRQKLEMGRKLYENEKLSSLGRLAASIAHEVKNPLSSIKSITQVMREDLPAEHPHQQDLAIVVSEVDRLTKVVNQLLGFARSRPAGPAPFTVAEALANVLVILGHSARQGEIEIATHVDPRLALVADRDAFTEIFFNLIDNAIQALGTAAEPPAAPSASGPFPAAPASGAPPAPPPGPPRVGGKIAVSVALRAVDETRPAELLAPAWRVAPGEHRLVIAVKDDGPGIPPELREKIFEPFFTTRRTGTGLGLAIVAEQVARLGGRVFLGEPERGAEFRVIVPVHPVSAPEAAESAAAPPAEPEEAGVGGPARA